MDLLSLDSVILIMVTCNNLLIAIFIFKVDFSETYLMTSAENNISEPPNLKIIFWWEDTPRPTYKACPFGTLNNVPPLQKVYLPPWKLILQLYIQMIKFNTK